MAVVATQGERLADGKYPLDLGSWLIVLHSCNGKWEGATFWLFPGTSLEHRSKCPLFPCCCEFKVKLNEENERSKLPSEVSSFCH